jgi:hypothetical protein
LFGVAAVLFIVVAVMYFREDDNNNRPAPTPASVPGKAQLKNVLDAVAAQDLEVDYIRAAGPTFPAFTRPAQGLTVNGQPLYVFIYESPELREEGTADLTPDDLVPESARGSDGTPAIEGTPHGVGASNVYAILFGGDEEMIAKVDAAIQGIP